MAEAVRPKPRKRKAKVKESRSDRQNVLASKLDDLNEEFQDCFDNEVKAVDSVNSDKLIGNFQDEARKEQLSDSFTKSDDSNEEFKDCIENNCKSDVDSVGNVCNPNSKRSSPEQPHDVGRNEDHNKIESINNVDGITETKREESGQVLVTDNDRVTDDGSTVIILKDSDESIINFSHNVVDDNIGQNVKNGDILDDSVHVDEFDLVKENEDFGDQNEIKSDGSVSISLDSIKHSSVMADDVIQNTDEPQKQLSVQENVVVKEIENCTEKEIDEVVIDDLKVTDQSHDLVKENENFGNQNEIQSDGSVSSSLEIKQQSSVMADDVIQNTDEPQKQLSVQENVVKEIENSTEKEIDDQSHDTTENIANDEVKDTDSIQPRPGFLDLHASALNKGPAVVEDPDTPMARVASPKDSATAVSEDSKSQTPSVAEAVVREEKSPHLLAEEAFARMQALAENLSVSTPQSVEQKEVSEKPDTENSKAESNVPLHPEIRQEEASPETRVIHRVVETAPEEERAPIHEEERSKFLEVPKTKIRAMSLSELLELYQNPQLAYNQQFVEDFIQNEMKKEGHEFFEILSSYLRSRLQLVNVEEEISLLQNTYSGLQETMWITGTKSIVVQGECGDKSKVTASHTYEQCQLNPEDVQQMENTLKNIRKMLSEELSLFAYSSMISKLQVESYIHNFYTESPLLRDIPKNAPVQAQSQYHVDQEGMRQINKLKDCISILFVFHRKPVADAEFVNNIRSWTTRLVSTLLRVATFRDHLFILNHVLRCPSGVSKWATDLVQFTKISPAQGPFQSNFANDVLDHIITALSTVLLPIRAREEFLSQMRVNLTQQSIQDEKTWIMVDSDGEEDEEPSNTWLYLHENDVVAILKQFSLSDLYSHILLSTVSESGQVDYDVRRSTEPIMMKLLSFSTVLVQLFGTGLRTYNMVRYRQLNKRIGRLIRHTVCFVSDHWLNFKTHYGPMTTNTSMDTLQMEFDQLFMRATYCILAAEKLGSWQFMADMPYTCVSVGSMWQLLWVLHQVQGQIINLDFLPPASECKDYLQDPDSWQQLADNLTHMPTSEAFFLMTTFANMACCRSYSEQDFIQTITYEVFQIAYINTHTRDFCSKVGRELLSTIFQTHPSAISFLLSRVKDVMPKLGKMALYLFSELPISIWQPTDPDMLIIRQWLLNFSLTFAENHLARIILSKINWDVFEQTGRPVIDIRLHRQTALLLVESYTRYISEKRAGFFITEGMKQMASYMTSTLSPEQTFNNWAWDLALKLKLHQQSVIWHGASYAVDPNFQPPRLSQDSWLLPILNGTANKVPIACFIALSMTDVGHDITSIMRDGLDLLRELTLSGQYTTTIHVLGCLVPLFMECQQYLLDSECFHQVLQSLVVADESLLKSTKSTVMNVEFPGLVIKQLNEMIQAQISSHLLQGKADLLLTFWLRAMFKVSRYFVDRNCCYVANSLVQWNFVKKGVMEVFMKTLMEFHTQFCAMVKDSQNMVSTVMNWISSSQNSSPSLLDSPVISEFPWLAFLVMSVEGEIELTSGLWNSLQLELHSNGRLSVDSALKSAASSLNIQQVSQKLLIYRWCKQALDTPVDHPLLPILWQRFFVLYLGRQATQNNLAQRASVGERFFESMSSSSMLKRMRKRLKETSDFHLNFDPMKKHSGQGDKTTSQPEDGLTDMSHRAGPSSPGDECNLEYISTKEFHQMLARLYQTFILWIEEPRLHDGNLYLPALPPQYEAARLNQIFQGYLGPWLEFVDTEGIQYTLSCLAADWRNCLSGEKSSNLEVTERHRLKEPENATKRIEQRLKRYDPPKDPPVIVKVQSAVPLISPTIVADRDAFQQLVSSDLELLRQHTQIFSAKNANHSALDDTYIQLVPSLYSNVSKVIHLTGECRSTLNPLHKCSLPANIPVRINEKERDEITFRRIQENRVEYKQLMIELLIPTPLNICVAAVHTENAITCLIKQCQKSCNSTQSQKLRDIGCQLFFYLTNLVTEETNFYPPSRLFLASCIEILGQEFVSQDPSQTDTVLQLCLDNALVSGLVSPHFVPNSCPNRFVDMYGQLIHVLQDQNMDLVFMLLTKFDLGLWLSTQRPTESDRNRLVEIMGSSLTACGANPEAKCDMVFGLYVNHLKSLLQVAFPSNLNCIFNMILQGSSTRGLHVQVWETFLSVCFSNDPANSGNFDVATIESCNEVLLSTVQVKELLDWLGAYFMRSRIEVCQNDGLGLYATWRNYVHHISLLLGGLIRSYVSKLLRGSDDMSHPFQILNSLWGVYAAWIQPMVGDNQTLNTPWKEEYKEAASYVISSLAKSLEFIYQQVSTHHPDRAPGLLSLILMYYLSVLCTKSTRTHMMKAYLTAIEGLPWNTLWPDIQLVEAMTKVKEVASPCCFSLVGYIMPFVKWESVNGFYIHHTHPEAASKMQTGIALLLIQCYVDKQVLQSESIYRLLVQAETFDWSIMSMEGITCVTSWFLQLSDPNCVLAERSTKLAIGLRLLKQVCGFTTYVQWQAHLVAKRQMYIHIVSQQFCQMTYREGTNMDTMDIALVNLMSEIEAVESTVPSMEGQIDESSCLLKSVCGLLNNSNPDGKWLDKILSTLTGWLHSSPQSILLAPCMKVASTSLASLRHMVVVLEACIASYFSGREEIDTTTSVPNGWDFILTIFHIPELNTSEFVQEALKESAFLVLYSYLRYKVPFCQTWDQNFALMEEILRITQRAEPCERDEMKILLYWHLLLDLLVKQLSLCPIPSISAINVVSRFIPYLNAVGQDRNNKGILGAIGLGQKSPLSKKMRLTAIALSSFLQSQQIDTNNLRLDASTPLPQNNLSKELRAIRIAKGYASLSAQCDKAIVFMRDPSHSLHEAPLFVCMMGLELFPDYIFLKHVFV